MRHRGSRLLSRLCSGHIVTLWPAYHERNAETSAASLRHFRSRHRGSRLPSRLCKGCMAALPSAPLPAVVPMSCRKRRLSGTGTLLCVCHKWPQLSLDCDEGCCALPIIPVWEHGCIALEDTDSIAWHMIGMQSSSQAPCAGWAIALTFSAAVAPMPWASWKSSSFSQRSLVASGPELDSTPAVLPCSAMACVTAGWQMMSMSPFRHRSRDSCKD